MAEAPRWALGSLPLSPAPAKPEFLRGPWPPPASSSIMMTTEHHFIQAKRPAMRAYRPACSPGH